MKKLQLVGDKTEVKLNDGDVSVRYTQHDILAFGEKLECEIAPSPCGYDLNYFITKTIKAPEIFGNMPALTRRESVFHSHIHPTWYWKLLLRTPEKEIKREITKFKKFVTETEQRRLALNEMTL